MRLVLMLAAFSGALALAWFTIAQLAKAIKEPDCEFYHRGGEHGSWTKINGCKNPETNCASCCMYCGLRDSKKDRRGRVVVSSCLRANQCPVIAVSGGA